MRKNGKGKKPNKPNGWHKEDTQTKRRRAVLRQHSGDTLATARALQYLSNISNDYDTSRKAGADAKYFFRLYHRKIDRGK